MPHGRGGQGQLGRQVGDLGDDLQYRRRQRQRLVRYGNADRVAAVVRVHVAGGERTGGVTRVAIRVVQAGQKRAAGRPQPHGRVPLGGELDRGRFGAAVAPIDDGRMRTRAARIAEGGLQRDRLAFAARQSGGLQLDRPDGVDRERELHGIASSQRIARQIDRRVSRVAAAHDQRVRPVRQWAGDRRQKRRVRRGVVANRSQRDPQIVAAAVLAAAVGAWRVQPVSRGVGHRAFACGTGIPHGLGKLQLELHHRGRGRLVRHGLDQGDPGRQLVHAQRREDSAAVGQPDRRVQHVVIRRQLAQRQRVRSVPVRGHGPRVPSKPARAVAVQDHQPIGPRVGHDQVRMAVAVHVAGVEVRTGRQAAGHQQRRERIAGQALGCDPHVVDRHDRTAAGRVADQVENQRGRRAWRQRRDVQRHLAAVPRHALGPGDGAVRVGIEERGRFGPKHGHQRLAGFVQQRDLEGIRHAAQRRLQAQCDQLERQRLRRRGNGERLVQRGEERVLLRFPQLGDAGQGIDRGIGGEGRIRHCGLPVPDVPDVPGSPAGQPCGEIAVDQRASRQQIVVLPQHGDPIAAAGCEVQVAVFVPVARRQAANRPQAADRRLGPRQEPAACQPLEERHRAVAMPDGQIGQRRAEERSHDHGDRLLAAAGVPHRRVQRPAAVAVAAEEHEDFAGPRQNRHHIRLEIAVQQRDRQVDGTVESGASRAESRSGGGAAGTPGLERGEPTGAVAAGDGEARVVLNDGVQQQVVVEQAQRQAVDAVQLQFQVADHQLVPTATAAVQGDGQASVGVQCDQIRPLITIDGLDRQRHGRAADRQRFVRRRGQGEHPAIFERFGGDGPRLPRPAAFRPAAGPPSPGSPSPRNAGHAAPRLSRRRRTSAPG